MGLNKNSDIVQSGECRSEESNVDFYVTNYCEAPYEQKTPRSRLSSGDLRGNKEHTQNPGAGGERAPSFPTITSLLNRFLQGNLAELNSDEHVVLTPSNIGDRQGLTNISEVGGDWRWE